MNETAFTEELNKIANEILYGTEKQKSKGTRTFWHNGTVGNKTVCFTKQRTSYNGRWGFWSWIQTHYKNGTTKRTLFAKSGSQKKAEKRADKLLLKLEQSNKKEVKE